MAIASRLTGGDERRTRDDRGDGVTTDRLALVAAANSSGAVDDDTAAEDDADGVPPGDARKFVLRRFNAVERAALATSFGRLDPTFGLEARAA